MLIYNRLVKLTFGYLLAFSNHLVKGLSCERFFFIGMNTVHFKGFISTIDFSFFFGEGVFSPPRGGGLGKGSLCSLSLEGEFPLPWRKRIKGRGT